MNKVYKIKNNMNDISELEFPIDFKQEQPFDIFVEEKVEVDNTGCIIPHKEYSIYLNSVLERPNKYNELFNLIRTAVPNDTINLYLNGVGGDLFTAMQLINALSVSDADVYAIADGQLISAHTLIFLSCRKFIIHDSCLFMFHNFTSGTYGKGNEQKAEIFAITEWFEKVVKQIYVPFLSEDEFIRIVRGEDIWMLSDEINERLLNIKKL